jgi:hypothetical protein
VHAAQEIDFFVDALLDSRAPTSSWSEKRAARRFRSASSASCPFVPPVYLEPVAQ